MTNAYIPEFVDAHEEYFETGPHWEFPGLATYHNHVSEEAVPPAMWAEYDRSLVDEWVAKRCTSEIQQPPENSEGDEEAPAAPEAAQTTAPDSIYSPIRKPYEIRVLEIHPGAPDDRLVGTLHHCSVEFRYEARYQENTRVLRAKRSQHALLTDNLNSPIWCKFSYTALGCVSRHQEFVHE